MAMNAYSEDLRKSLRGPARNFSCLTRPHSIKQPLHLCLTFLLPAYAGGFLACQTVAEWPACLRGDRVAASMTSLALSQGGYIVVMGIKERRFDPLPHEISLEDLLPQDSFYRRLEAALDL